jgi:hypothetical protein
MEIIPLYSQDGGPPKAYKCVRCGAVTKTSVGIDRHLWQKHKVRHQLDLFSNQSIIDTHEQSPTADWSPVDIP